MYGVALLPEATGTLWKMTAGSRSAGASEQAQLIPVLTGVNRFSLLPVAALFEHKFDLGDLSKVSQVVFVIGHWHARVAFD